MGWSFQRYSEGRLGNLAVRFDPLFQKSLATGVPAHQDDCRVYFIVSFFPMFPANRGIVNRCPYPWSTFVHPAAAFSEIASHGQSQP
jgi:hypothetical protein